MFSHEQSHIGQLLVVYWSTVAGILVNCCWYIGQLLLVYLSTVSGILVNRYWHIGQLLKTLVTFRFIYAADPLLENMTKIVCLH